MATNRGGATPAVRTGARVRVHWNLTRGGFVVRGLPMRVGDMAYVDAVCLKNAVFKVSAATRDKCRATGQRWVHAWVEGERCRCSAVDGVDVTYNPHRDAGFVVRGTSEPVVEGMHVAFRTVGGKPATWVRA